MNVLPFSMLMITFVLCDPHNAVHVKLVSSGVDLHGNSRQLVLIKTKEKVLGHAHVEYHADGDHHHHHEGGHYHVKYHEHYPSHGKFYYKVHGHYRY